MTKEKKDLLLKDLCGRLPYGVIIQVKSNNADVLFENEVLTAFNLCAYYDSIEIVKPYLRPMPSMTEEEKDEYSKTCEFIEESHSIGVVTSKSVDWLNAHHFDYRGLIPMGLAIEAPEDMYKNV